MDIAQSVEAILVDQDNVSARFYEALFAEHPRLRSYFQDVDLAHQAEKLRNALLTVQWNHAKGLYPHRNYLHTLGRMHRDMGIAPSDFPLFSGTLVRVLAEFHGTDWSNALKREWEAALDAAVGVMLEEYGNEGD